MNAGSAQIEALALAVDAVYDAHDTPTSRRILIRGQLAARARAQSVAEAHVYHNGGWALGSCDAELFALEWEIYLAMAPKPKIGWRDRLRAALARLDGAS